MQSSLKRLLKVATYDQFWNMVQLNHSKVNQEVKLIKDEAIALYAYTLCHPPFYKEINKALRNGDTNNFIIKLIDSAIKNLPIYRGKYVFRWTLPLLEEKEKLDSYEEVFEKAYLSTLKFPNEITMADPECILFKIEHLNGRDIALYSDDYSIDIQEVILPRGSSFINTLTRCDEINYIIRQVT